MTLNRRSMFIGLGCMAAATAIRADDDKPVSPIAHGVLANNALAGIFEPFTDDLPSVHIQGPDGETPVADLIKGRTILMPLWAEWCGPCVQELPDFARLQGKYGNDKFAIIPVLTATKKAFDPPLLAKIFDMMHCSAIQPLIEHGRGDHLARAMAHAHGYVYALPCNLLIGPDGHTVARDIGRLDNTDDKNPAKNYTDALNRTATGASQSRWGQADGDAFAKAMADGFLG
jgi:thiol-disulfide isomerase/thioredoxin